MDLFYPKDVVEEILSNQEGEVRWLSEEYSRASGQSRYYYPSKLWPWRNLMTIEKLDDWYADTDLDWMEYAEEYQRSISGILNGRIILNPQKLALEENLSEWVECLTESVRADYRKAFEEIKEGKIPIIRECDYVAY